MAASQSCRMQHGCPPVVQEAVQVSVCLSSQSVLSCSAGKSRKTQEAATRSKPSSPTRHRATLEQHAEQVEGTWRMK
jgi:hypothetical protein